MRELYRELYPSLGTSRSSAQKKMIQVIYENKMPGAVFVLPTAGGKSLAYIVPCLCDPASSIAVAIVPPPSRKKPMPRHLHLVFTRSTINQATRARYHFFSCQFSTLSQILSNIFSDPNNIRRFFVGSLSMKPVSF